MNPFPTVRAVAAALITFGLAIAPSSSSAAPGRGEAGWPYSWRGTQAGSSSAVLTLGSMHLNEFGPTFALDRLEPLLRKLAAFHPEIITHEGLSGEQCEQIARDPARYKGVWDDYCWGTDEGRIATGLSRVDAGAAAETAFVALGSSPAAAARRHLAALLVAAGDRPSAQVQWRRLAPEARTEGDGIDAAVKAVLDTSLTSRNETYSIAVALAVRLGLERVYPVDDHTADAIQIAAPAGFDAALTAHFARPRPALDPLIKREKNLASAGDILAFYRELNAPGTLKLLLDNDFHAAMQDPVPGLHGRRYLAWYETRNLRMVANIRAAYGNHPGARVLNIVGASHKALYDTYLGMMADTVVVNAATVLR